MQSETRLCNKCEEVKPLTKEFFYWQRGRFRLTCKSCMLKQGIAWRASIYAKGDEFKEEFHKKQYEKRKQNFKKDPALKERYLDTGRDYSKRQRLEVLRHYSKGTMQCFCCGESTLEFLSIEHINADGYKQRQDSKVSRGGRFYKWIIDNNFPEGLGVLCHNCNGSRGYYGYCPHQNPELAGFLKKVKQTTPRSQL